jgi:hypothetical protein
MAANNKKLTKAQKNVLIDTTMLGLFSVALAQEATGLAFHEWVGLAAAGTAGVHLLLHGKWVVQSTKRFFGKMPRKTRASYLLNGLLLANVGLIAFSGMSMSEVAAPGLINSGSAGIWSDIHEAAAGAFIGIAGAHLALHLKWILSMGKKYLVQPLASSNITRRQRNTVVIENRN